MVLKSEVRDGSSKCRQVITDNCKRATFFNDHVGRSHSTKRVNHQRAGGPLDTKDLTLAILGSRECGAGSAVVVEEAV